MRLATIILLLLFQVDFTIGQTVEAGDVFDKISTIISNMPEENGDDYSEPTNNEILDWQDLLVDVFSANYSDADNKADALGYDLVEFSDNTTNETYYILEKLGNGANHWGTYILNPNAQRSEVILMAPHPKFDFNTGKQGIYCFKDIDAGFFMMAGTHRCNHSDTTLCSGTTQVCGGNDPYRISDLAHTVNSIWQVTTDYLFNLTPDSYFIQLHGFTMTGSDPYVIMSNGTRQTPMLDPITIIRDELEFVDPMLTFKIAHIDQNWDRLIGFTNTNGRMINSSNSACNSNATATSGRFVHIEQEKTSLRSNSFGWQKMATALSESFPLAALPVELTSFDTKIEGTKIKLSWTVEMEINNDYFEVEKSTDGKIFHSIGKINGRGNANSQKEYHLWDKPNVGQNYYRLRQYDFDGSNSLSQTRNVKFDIGKISNANISVVGNQITIKINNDEENAEIQFFDSLGRTFSSSKLSPGDNLISLEHLKNRICFYRIIANRQLVHSGIITLH